MPDRDEHDRSIPLSTDSRIEWRTGARGDVVVMIGDDGRVTRAIAADPAMISVLLTDMDFATDEGPPAAIATESSEEWGDVVISRAANGAVIEVEPELYWDGIHRLFRSRGVDYDTLRRSPR